MAGAVVYLYGPDKDEMLAAARPLIEGFALRPPYAMLTGDDPMPYQSGSISDDRGDAMTRDWRIDASAGLTPTPLRSGRWCHETRRRFPVTPVLRCGAVRWRQSPHGRWPSPKAPSHTRDRTRNGVPTGRIQAAVLGIPAWIATPEDIILAKLRWRVDSRSEVQWRDCVEIAATAVLDEEYLLRWGDDLGVAADLAELLALSGGETPSPSAE
jgi:hypothetical protein